MAAIAAASPAATVRRSFPRSQPPSSFSCSSPSSPSSLSSLSIPQSARFASIRSRNTRRRSSNAKRWGVKCSARKPLKVMISGAPASGKGTQCEMIVQKFGLVHISTGDLLRAEVSSGTEIGKKAKEYMDNGLLVPDEIVTDMVIGRLSQEDAREKGWLLDGYPRSFAQAQSLEKLKIRPDICIVLDVPDEILIDRCVGRRLDPMTGKIYHLKSFPPETEEISSRLITRSDDTEEKVKSRLETYKQNAQPISSTYMDVLVKVDGNRPREVIFEEIDSLLQRVSAGEINSKKSDHLKGLVPLKDVDTKLAASNQDTWRGIPTKLNNIPHSREIRKYFYDDVLRATQKAVEDKRSLLKLYDPSGILSIISRSIGVSSLDTSFSSSSVASMNSAGLLDLQIEINIPELNPEMDVYRIGTLLELVRTLALSFADDGKHVKVCVQGSMGEGALAGMPLQLAGSRRILEFMDWGDYGTKGAFINIGSIGAREVDEQDDMFILVAPQNAVGNCIIDDMKAMTDAAGDRPVILVNPRLKDLPGSSGIMQAMGREQRLAYAASFESCYFFRLLYYAGTQYPIMGALRMTYASHYELYKRVDEPYGKEKYVSIATFPQKPTVHEINDAFQGKARSKEKTASGFWYEIIRHNFATPDFKGKLGLFLPH